MRVISAAGIRRRVPWPAGGLVCLALAACATTPRAERAEAQGGEEADMGYGTAPVEHATGSVSTQVVEDHAQTDSRTLLKMLTRVPGVQVQEMPGGEVRIRIRGTNSFQSGNDPLFVIDGMVVQISGAGLAGINPSTVRSITVLKDAGSTAIYGSRGANGVILIRTKRGAGSGGG